MKLLKLLTFAWFLVPSLCFANPGMMLIAGGGVAEEPPAGGISETFDDQTSFDANWTAQNGAWTVSGGEITGITGTNSMAYHTSGVGSLNQHACIEFSSLTSLPNGGFVEIAFRANSSGDTVTVNIGNYTGVFKLRGARYETNGYAEGGGAMTEITAADSSYLCGEVTGPTATPTVKSWYFTSAPAAYGSWGTADYTDTYTGTSTADGQTVGLYGNYQTADTGITGMTGDAN